MRSPSPWMWFWAKSHKLRSVSQDSMSIGFYDQGAGATDEEHEANREFIVRACNAHDGLIAALRTAAEDLIYDDYEDAAKHISEALENLCHGQHSWEHTEVLRDADEYTCMICGAVQERTGIITQ